MLTQKPASSHVMTNDDVNETWSCFDYDRIYNTSKGKRQTLLHHRFDMLSMSLVYIHNSVP